MSDFFPADTSRKSLLASQKLVAQRVIVKDDFRELKLIGGVDQAFMDETIISAIVVMDYVSLEVKERVHSIQPVNYPYIPTFLSFREGPAIVSAFKKLNIVPDILMVDGAGINHPRNSGIATHIGVALDVPTIGITKKILCGKAEVPSTPGDATTLVHKGNRIGWLLKSEKRSRPIVVAPGHRVSIESSLSIVKNCLRGHKLPEPLRLAHNYVNELKNSIT